MSRRAPHLAWCARFALRAACSLRGRMAEVTLESGDPVFPATPPAPFDSRVVAMIATSSRRIRRARRVMSSRFPIGVATR